MRAHSIRLDRSIHRVVKGRIEQYNFEVGVLENKPHRLPSNSTTTYLGAPVRRASMTPSGLSISEVSKRLRDIMTTDYLVAPFRSGKNKDILNMLNDFFNLIRGSTREKRLVNSLQAVVRNPFIRGDYGMNSPVTAKIKGFNSWGIDTAQLFKNIKARVRRKRV
jgi:hypothetical protein